MRDGMTPNGPGLALQYSSANSVSGSLLAFGEAGQSRAFNHRHVDKNILAALVGSDEPKSLAWIEPLHDPCRHDHSLSLEYSQRQARRLLGALSLYLQSHGISADRNAIEDARASPVV